MKKLRILGIENKTNEFDLMTRKTSFSSFTDDASEKCSRFLLHLNIAIDRQRALVVLAIEAEKCEEKERSNNDYVLDSCNDFFFGLIFLYKTMLFWHSVSNDGVNNKQIKKNIVSSELENSELSFSMLMISAYQND